MGDADDDAGDGERNLPQIVAQGILRAVTQKESRNAKTRAFEERKRKAQTSLAKVGAPWSPLEPNYQSTSESFPQNFPPPSAGPCSSFGSRFACGFGDQGAARRSTPTHLCAFQSSNHTHLQENRTTFVVELESSISTSHFPPAIPATNQARYPPVNRPTRNTPTVVNTPPGELNTQSAS